ncbi:MAG: GIN domain-containing protein [Flavobacteriaceae bacterium]
MKQYTYVGFISLFLLVTSLVAQNNPLDEPRTRVLNDFHQLNVYSGIYVNLIPAKVNKAIIYGDRYGSIRLIQKGKTLKLRRRLDELFYSTKAYVDLYFKPPLNSIKLHQKANLSTEAILQQNHLQLNVHEGSKFKGTVNTKQLITKVRTGGHALVDGTAEQHRIIVSTGGLCKAMKLSTNRTRIKIFAGGKANIFAKDQIEASVAFGGNIWILGNPKNLIARRTIAGQINHYDNTLTETSN